MKRTMHPISASGRVIALLLAAVMISAVCALHISAADGDSGKTTIKVFETSDIHGYLMDTSGGTEDKFQYRLAYISRCINDARSSGEYDDVLLVDGGDIYQGAPVSNLLYGAGLRAAMDAMGYDAFSLGNHEFDWGVTEYCADPDGTVPAYALAEYSGDPDIPILAGNLYDAATGEHVNFTRDYTVVEKAGLRIALIGYIPDYSREIMTSRIAPYTIDESLEHLKERVKEINSKEKPDVTVIVAHASPEPVAAAMDPSQVQLVTGGHKHMGISGVAENGITFIQSDCYAKGYASAVITLDKSTGEIDIGEPTYTQIVGTELENRLYERSENAPYLDPEIMAISHAAWSAVGAGMGEVLGYIDYNVEKKGYTDVQGDNDATSGGNFITGIMLAAMKDQGAEVAFYNKGGVRADFVIPEGETVREVTVGDVYAISPFGNKWLLYDLTGADLAKQLCDGLSESNFGNQVTGLTFTYYQLGTQDSHPVYYVDSITMADGREVDIRDTTTTYRICITDYSATVPESVCVGKEPVVPIQDAPTDHLAIIEYLRDNKSRGDGYIPIDNSARAKKLSVCGLHSDVSEDASYHEAVDYVMKKGLMIGVSRDRFAPLDKVSRAMAVTVMYRLAGAPEVEAKPLFSDVAVDSWYTDAVAWAAENEISAGDEKGLFGIGESITMEQFITFLWQYSGKPEADMSRLDAYTDGHEVSESSRNAFAWALSIGIAESAEQNILEPQEEMARADLAVMLQRFAKAEKGN